MDLQNLKQDRFLRKDANQTDQTKGAAYASSNPAPKRGDDSLRKIGRPSGAEEDDGSRNILTGTVIVACFIQTSALPSRIEIEGNDITFFDDTYTENGRVVGDTSRLVFTHGSGKRGEQILQGFIMEKRASVYNTYDNVLSWFAMPAAEGAHNYMFIGRNAYSSDEQRNLHSINFAINRDSAFEQPTGNPLNGVFRIEYAEDEVSIAPVFAGGSSASLFEGSGLTGFSSVIVGGDGGISGIGFLDPSTGNIAIAMYMLSENAVTLGADLIPDTNGAYDIGSPTFKIGTFYGSVSACPLPTVDNALAILDRIPQPTYVGDRGHYGENRKYFDDLTFPQEILYTNPKGVTDIEHNHLLGFLLKAVIELKAEVDFLKGKL